MQQDAHVCTYVRHAYVFMQYVCFSSADSFMLYATHMFVSNFTPFFFFLFHTFLYAFFFQFHMCFHTFSFLISYAFHMFLILCFLIFLFCTLSNVMYIACTIHTRGVADAKHGSTIPCIL